MLCKCSGKYIDIYFNLKITFLCIDLKVFDKLIGNVLFFCGGGVGGAPRYPNIFKMSPPYR